MFDPADAQAHRRKRLLETRLMKKYHEICIITEDLKVILARTANGLNTCGPRSTSSTAERRSNASCRTVSIVADFWKREEVFGDDPVCNVFFFYFALPFALELCRT
jgi:hypothetical protein